MQPQDQNQPATQTQPTTPVQSQPNFQQVQSPQVQTPVERVSLSDMSSFTPQSSASQPMPSPDERENIYTEICSQIIKEQEKIIGSIAIEQANKVSGLSVDPVTYHCTITGDGSNVIDDLIEQYREFFGHAAVEVCKEAVSRILARLPLDALPSSLR